MKKRSNDKQTILEYNKTLKPTAEALKLLIIYLLIGCLWIFFSDRILQFMNLSEELYARAQMYKGWFYVIVSGAVFYWIFRNKLHLFASAKDQITKMYYDLEQVNNDLMRKEDDLEKAYRELQTNQEALIKSEQRYQLAVDSANDGLWDFDIKTGEYFCTPKWAEQFGWNNSDYEAFYEIWSQQIHPSDRKQIIANIQEYMDRPVGNYESFYRLKDKNGTYRMIQTKAKALRDAEGNVIRFAGSHSDMTSYYDLQNALRTEEQVLRHLIDQAPILVMLLDEDARILRFNRYGEQVTGYRECDILGKDAINLLIEGKDEREAARRVMSRKSPREFNGGNDEIDVITKDGKRLSMIWDSRYSKLSESMNGYIVIGMDITERKEMLVRLNEHLYYDPLTKMPNAVMFVQELDAIMHNARNQDRIVALISLGIDNFKYFNELMGREKGDAILKQISIVLTQCTLEKDLIGRISGDQFAILVKDKANLTEILQYTEHVFNTLKIPIMYDEQKFYVSFSMGVALFPLHANDSKRLIQCADTALNHAKDAGKNQFIVYSASMEKKSVEYMSLNNQICWAIENTRFELVYQPQIDLVSNKIIGMESLIRLRNEQDKIIMPNDFIPFAEDHGLISEIEAWSSKEACKQIMRWTQAGYRDMKIGINVSARSLNMPNFVQQFQDVIHTWCVDFRCVQIEITETMLLTDFEQTMETLRRLKMIGVSIALDDFGTGYSSLMYLNELPIDVVKIDRMFIKDVMNSVRKQHVFRSIIELSHNLGMSVIAEGVETLEQLSFVRENACNIVQGYYYSMPMDAKTADVFLAKWDT